jgi:AcrR family transcriptional regulator
MTSMSISYTATGRTKQKQRTLDAINAATRELLRAGTIPTVEESADVAGVSRATAYRYFPNQRELLTAAHEWTESPSLVPDGLPDDPEARLIAVVDRIIAMTVESETAHRTMLRLSLEGHVPGEGDLALRKGRRITWVEDALEPVRRRLGPRRFRRLVRAIAASIGIEVLVWMTDVARMSREDAMATMRWSATALLRAALYEP